MVVGSVIDNLVMGASGQAFQNLNLMLVLVETEGGDVDARIHVQVEALRRALAELE